MSAENSSATYSLDIVKPVPFLKSKLKFVYNINKRIEKEKNIRNNAGNYIALQTKYSFGRSANSTYNRSMLTELHWGIQRDLGGNFLFNTHIGLGYLGDFNSNSWAFSPPIGVSFGYRIFQLFFHFNRSLRLGRIIHAGLCRGFLFSLIFVIPL